ncbi:hypothetical protein BSKO_03031 [Bryopsis sp. KO-2023]|nr:hypothetical protein BSKO_03031 [Bryopsis sp. KO-2023]
MGALKWPRELFRAVGWLGIVLLLSDGVSARALRSEGEDVNSQGGGFLEDELPLTIVVTTPTKLSSERETSLTVRDQQAITVVYSRSVIALGQDFGTTILPDDKVPFTLEPSVPGRFRWVTTYIARWDPEGSWPLDSKIKFKLNSKLKTHDGILFNTTGISDSITLTTPSLRMSFAGVKSEAAQNLTDGNWTPNSGIRDDVLPEVPPDGILQLTFNHDVSISVLTKELQILDENETAISSLKAVVSPCEPDSFISPILPCIKCGSNRKGKKTNPEESSCVQVSIDGELEIQTEYNLFLPKGIMYSKKAGLLTKKKTAKFGGLRTFRIPLRAKQRVSSRVLRLNLPHGLEESNSKGVEALKQQFEFISTETEEKIDFDMTLKNKGTLEIRAELMPSTEYRLNVIESNDVLDGFGLPLLGSSTLMETVGLEDKFGVVDAANGMIFEAGEDWGKKLVAAYIGNSVKAKCPGVPPATVNAYRVLGQKELKSALGAQLNGVPSKSIADRFRSPGLSFTREGNDKLGELAEADISKLLKPSGIVLFEHCVKGFYQSRIDVNMVTETDLQVIALGSSVGSSLVFVTSMKTGKPVSGAKVMLYRNSFNRFEEVNKLDPQVIKPVAHSKTNEDGIALFDESFSEMHLHVEHRKDAVLMPGIRSGHFNGGPDDVARLVLDKKLAQPGQSMHIKGYVLKPTGKDDLSWEPKPLVNPIVKLSPSLNPDEITPDQFSVEMDEKFGTFELEIPIPEGAPLKEYSVDLLSENSLNDYFYLTSARFTVADPRPPTVELTIDAPFWARPNSTVTIDLTAESFIGSAVGDAEITLKWSIPGSEKSLDGEIEVKTDASGKGKAEIDLSDLETIPKPGQTLTIDATWVGPTRELIEKSTSVMLEVADVKLKFRRTVATDFPGQEFGVLAELTDLKGVPFEKTNLLLELKQLDESMEERPLASDLEPLDGSIVDSCEIASDSEAFGCRFSLPDVGAFALESCIEVPEEGTEKDIMVCTRVFLGKTAKEWEARGPIEDHILKLGFQKLDAAGSKVGGTAKFGIENPFHNVKAILMWGSKLGTQHKMISLEDFSFNEVEIELGKNCVAGCSVKFAVSIPRQTSGAILESKIPVSKVFDLAMPHSTSYDADITVEQDTSFDVDLSFPDLAADENNDFVLPPGETTKIEVQIQEGGPGEADVTVVAVDKAILDLIPHALQDVASDFVLDFTGSFAMEESAEYLVAPSAIKSLIQDFARRKKLDPWFYPVLEARHGRGVDLSDEEYLEQNSEFITSYETHSSFGGGRGRGGGFATVRTFARSDALAFSSNAAVQPPAAEPSTAVFSVGTKGRSASFGPPPQLSAKIAVADDAIGGAGFAAEGPKISVRVQKGFLSTPLFESGVTEGGIAAVNFTAPDNLGTFIVRAYASTGTGRFGNAEEELIVRRVISLTPSAPRFARVGDVFEAGAVVTVSGSSKNRPSVSVRVLMEGETGERLELVDGGERTYNASDDGTDEIRFRFRAKRVGDATFKIIADVDGAGDALVIDFPIEGLQEAVTVASSFAIDGNSSQQWTEGLQLPNAVPGSGDVKIQAGVGRMPVILSLAEEIYLQNPNHECPLHPHHSLALSAIPFITETYKVLHLDRNALAPQTGDILSGMLTNLTAAIESLKEMTTDRLGLTRDNIERCRREGSVRSFQRTPSIHLNAQGVWLLATLRADIGNSLLEDAEGTRSNSLASFEETWTSVLSQALAIEAVRSRNSRFPFPISAGTVAVARWALGGNWTPPFQIDETIERDLSMQRLSEEFDNLSVVHQAYYVHARLGMFDGINHPDVHKAINTWTNNFRVGGRTAYIAAFHGSATPASNIGNSLVLSVMTKTGIRNALVEKLANYIGSPPVGPYRVRSFGNFDKVVTMVSLRDYDVARGSNQPDLDLKVRSGEKDLLEVLFQGNNQVVASSSTPWEALASPPEPLEFQAQGIGEVTLAASLSFVPAKLLPFPTYRGMFIERSITISESENGASLKTIPVGSVVEVSVQMTTPDRLDETTVRVLMPAGLEPIDPNVDGSGNFCPVPFYSFFGGNSFFSFFSCPEQETRPSVVTFNYRSLTAGTHTLSFRAVAATAGEFALPPVRAFVNEQPELMGLSKAGSLTICTGKDCQAVEDSLPKIPKMCPKNCNDNGGCDLDTGSCFCLPGFGGEDCGQYTAA